MAIGFVRVVAPHTGVNFLLDTFVEDAKISNFIAAQIDEWNGECQETGVPLVVDNSVFDTLGGYENEIIEGEIWKSSNSTYTRQRFESKRVFMWVLRIF